MMGYNYWGGFWICIYGQYYGGLNIMFRYQCEGDVPPNKQRYHSWQTEIAHQSGSFFITVSVWESNLLLLIWTGIDEISVDIDYAKTLDTSKTCPGQEGLSCVCGSKTGKDSWGTDGFRTFSGIPDDEIMMGFPAGILPEKNGWCDPGRHWCARSGLIWYIQVRWKKWEK